MLLSYGSLTLHRTMSEVSVRLSPFQRLRRFARRFRRADRGATAVEFGLLAAPLLLMTMGVLELAVVFLVSITLDMAMQLSSRQIRTGQFQLGANNTQADFKALVCSNMTWLQSQCASSMSLDVRTFSTFSALASAHTLTPSNLSTTSFCYSPGQPTDIVLVRAYFQWTLFTPLLNNALANMGSNVRLITSTTAFRNEPYNANPPQGNSPCPSLT